MVLIFVGKKLSTYLKFLSSWRNPHIISFVLPFVKTFIRKLFLTSLFKCQLLCCRMNSTRSFNSVLSHISRKLLKKPIRREPNGEFWFNSCILFPIKGKFGFSRQVYIIWTVVGVENWCRKWFKQEISSCKTCSLDVLLIAILQIAETDEKGLALLYLHCFSTLGGLTSPCEGYPCR